MNTILELPNKDPVVAMINIIKKKKIGKKTQEKLDSSAKVLESKK